MKLATLKRSLNLSRQRLMVSTTHYKLVDQSPADTALAEVTEVEAAYAQNISGQYIPDCNADDSYIVGYNSLTDMLIFCTYEMYGAVYHANNNFIDLDLFLKGCRGASVLCPMLNEVPKAALETTFEIVGDLWTQNEESGHNLSSGNLFYHLVKCEAKLVQDILERLINADLYTATLEPHEIKNVQTLINNLKGLKK